MGTMEGLSTPLFGAFKHYDTSQTEVWSVDNGGMFNFAITSPGADNLLEVVVTDSTTTASGYLQPVYSKITTSGSWTTGNAQLNAFAADLFLGGTVGCEAHGLAVYITKSGSPTLTSAQPAGVQVYIDDLGSSPSSRAALRLHIADGNAASTNDAFIIMRIEGSSGAVTNMFEKAGTATNPTYFLKTNATDGMINAGDVTASGATAQSLVCMIGGAIKHIPLYTNS